MLLSGQSVLTLEAFSTKAYLKILVHFHYKQPERRIIIIIIFVGNHFWVNICLQKLPSSSSIKTPWWVFINDVFGIHLTSCVSPIALFRVHESRMWLTLCMIISPQLHWSVNKSVLSVSVCLQHVGYQARHEFSKSICTTNSRKECALQVGLQSTERAYMTEWMTDSDKFIQLAYNGTAHPVVKKG